MRNINMSFVLGMQNAGIVVGMSLIAFEQPYADLNGIFPIFMALTETFIALPFLLTHVLVLKVSSQYKNLCDRDRKAQQVKYLSTKIPVHGENYC